MEWYCDMHIKVMSIVVIIQNNYSLYALSDVYHYRILLFHITTFSPVFYSNYFSLFERGDHGTTQDDVNDG